MIAGDLGHFLFALNFNRVEFFERVEQSFGNCPKYIQARSDDDDPRRIPLSELVRSVWRRYVRAA